MATNRVELNRRERAILDAVASGRATLISCCEPDLLVDGGWCDHAAVHRLRELGLIEGVAQVPFGEFTPAVATEAGKAALESNGGLAA
ncbi:hypothetical protein [Amycolatopsis oliviviridis]|nr:hypothetical protein [Amycolatopsis oliviviridis]